LPWISKSFIFFFSFLSIVSFHFSIHYCHFISHDLEELTFPGSFSSLHSWVDCSLYIRKWNNAPSSRDLSGASSTTSRLHSSLEQWTGETPQRANVTFQINQLYYFAVFSACLKSQWIFSWYT
jgi:hypothetical protein